MFFKKKIVIRAFTVRRDLLTSYILKKILEKSNYSVEICSSRNFHRTLKYWKPEIIIINSVTQALACKEILPQAKVVLWPGEGANRQTASDAKIIFDKNISLSLFDLIFVWGKKPLEFYKEYFPNIKLDKIKLCGNPKLDLIKFNTKIKKNTDKNKIKKSVGILMRHHTINRYNWVPTIFSITSERNKKNIYWQIETFHSTIELIKRIIKETNFHVSLRPHPLESIEGYKLLFSTTSLKKFGFMERVSIDDTYDTANWCSNQRVIISTSSTSFYEVSILKIPLINIDKASKIEKITKEIYHNASKSQEISHLVNNYDEAISLIKDLNLKYVENKKIMEHIDDFNYYFNDKSAILNTAKEIKKLKINKKFSLFLPMFILNLFDIISVKRNLSIDPYHFNFSYYKKHHKIPRYIDAIINNIMNK